MVVSALENKKAEESHGMEGEDGVRNCILSEVVSGVDASGQQEPRGLQGWG